MLGLPSQDWGVFHGMSESPDEAQPDNHALSHNAAAKAAAASHARRAPRPRLIHRVFMPDLLREGAGGVP